MTLVDSYGRKASSLRMALTARCNLNCTYCHHEGEVAPRSEIPLETAVNVASAAAELGFRSIKLTGGEPLLRTDLEKMLSMMPPLDLSLTTNGVLLAGRAKSLAQAGLDRVNVSLDSLDPQTYQSITRSSPGDLQKVIDGIDAALDSGLRPVKLNVVVLKENQGEVSRLMDFCKDRGLVLQLIELLDLKGQGYGGNVESLEAILQSRADKIAVREMHRRKKYFLEGAEVEVVRPMDNTEFCANCTRLRVTSDGKLKPCLLRNDNLLEIGSCNKEEIKDLIVAANSRRSPYFAKSMR